jgi:RimJ/RimL family protein N-acetyltransferase
MSDRAAITPSRSSDYELVPAKSVDERRLIEFAAAVWPDRSPHEHFLTGWWKRADPAGAVAAVHRPTGEMAGICGGRPCEWTIAGQMLPAVAICDWYVAPAHAGKGLGKRLVQHFEVPGRFLYAFSISEAAIANFKKLGWEGAFRSALMIVSLPRLVAIPWSLTIGRSGLELLDYDIGGGESLGALAADLDQIEASRTGDGSSHMRRGAQDWSWRLSLCGDRRYRFCVARQAGKAVGYAVARPMAPGSSRQLGKLRAAIITDLVAVDDDAKVLGALARKSVAIAGELRAAIAVVATTAAAHRAALARAGFLSPGFPVLGRILARRAPQFMWLPRGPSVTLSAENVAMTFADAAVDLDL